MSEQINANQIQPDQKELKKVLSLWQMIIYGIAFMAPIATAYVFGYITSMTLGMVALAY